MPRRAKPTIKLYTFMRSGAKALRCVAYDVHDAVHFAMHLKEHSVYSPLVISYKGEDVMKLQPNERNVDKDRMEDVLGTVMRQTDDRERRVA